MIISYRKWSDFYECGVFLSSFEIAHSIYDVLRSHILDDEFG